jgi:hypothetical protein
MLRPPERSSFLPSRETANTFQTCSSNEARTRGEFRAQASSILARPGVPDEPARENAFSIDAAGQDTELGGILEAIALDVARMSAGASAAAMAEYAGAIDGARKQFPKHLVGGIIRSLKDALQAKLAAIKATAKIDLAERREAAIRAHLRHFRVVSRRPPDAPNRI